MSDLIPLLAGLIAASYCAVLLCIGYAVGVSRARVRRRVHPVSNLSKPPDALLPRHAGRMEFRD